MTNEGKYQDLYNIGLDKEKFGEDSVDQILGELHIDNSPVLGYFRTSEHNEVGPTGELNIHQVKRELESYHSSKNVAVVEEIPGSYDTFIDHFKRINTDYGLDLSDKVLEGNSIGLEYALEMADARGNDHDPFKVIMSYERLVLEDKDLAKEVLTKGTLVSVYSNLNQESVDTYLVGAKKLFKIYQDTKNEDGADPTLIKTQLDNYLCQDNDELVSLVRKENDSNKSESGWKMAGIGLAALVAGGIFGSAISGGDELAPVVEPVALTCPVEQSDYNAVVARSAELQSRLDEMDYAERLLGAEDEAAQIEVMDSYAHDHGGLVKGDNLDHFFENFTANTAVDLDADGQRIKEIFRSHGMTNRLSGWEE